MNRDDKSIYLSPSTKLEKMRENEYTLVLKIIFFSGVVCTGDLCVLCFSKNKIKEKKKKF